MVRPVLSLIFQAACMHGIEREGRQWDITAHEGKDRYKETSQLFQWNE